MNKELDLHFAMQDAKNAYLKCQSVRKVAKVAWDNSGHCIDKAIYKNLGVKLKDLAMKLAIARMAYEANHTI
jgi:hypothetical protein